MDIELQKLLIETLKDLKTNASPAFQELVDQYAGIHMAYAICGLVVGVCIIATGMIMSYFFKKSSDIDLHDNYEVPTIIGLILALIVTGISVGTNLPSALYPLGNVLGMLK